ncbi:MAG: phosphoenolpyruvate--protein phosphotransferase [candidate division WOR-3 bacterium]|nr:MAG: phosphoenolpyruvate--protein phosphotransferase [candidate division WOR-3 bacterium]
MKRRRERILRGIPVSAGFAVGPVFVYRHELPEFSEQTIESGSAKEEVKRFRDAVKSAESDLRKLHDEVKSDMGRDFAEFISIQIALLTDKDVLGQTEQFITDEAKNAEFAYTETLKRLAGPMATSTVPFFRERALDVGDVSARVLRQLLGEELPSLHEVEQGSVIAAHDLPPSEAALLDPQVVRGLVLEGGGRTSHTAIMAKAKEIPALVGTEGLLHEAVKGQQAVVDGYRGLVVLNPSRNRLGQYQSEMERYERHRESLAELTAEEAVTQDGKMIDLSANIEFLAEARAAQKYGARGIGLFRTEYMYLARRRPPTEDEQLEVYTEVAKMCEPNPVIIRTFDIGGDKVVPGYTEPNPFLGWRGLRLCFDHPELLRTQLRAVLRASVFGNVKVMYPMVSTMGEWRRARMILEQVKKELTKEKQEFNRQLDAGVMIETPSAAMMADQFALECAFLSIGSNDLTQYTLAVDRGNERVARLYDNFHPSVLRLIKGTIEAAHRHGIWVGLCGEFASDPLGMLILLGFGIDELSVTPGAIPEAKNVIRSIDTGSAGEIAQAAMQLGTGLEVKRMLRQGLHSRFPKLAEFLFELAGEEIDDE